MPIFEKMTEMGFTRLAVRLSHSYSREVDWIKEIMKRDGHEVVHLIHRPEVKLKAAIAIHDRTLGKSALGGCRMLNYATEQDMIMDALRLSKAMTYKSAMAGMKRGGAKCVVWGDSKKDKTRALLLALADEINKLEGRYITGEDMGIREQDVKTMFERTSYVAGLPSTTFRKKGARGSGNPGPLTADGDFFGIGACLKFLYGQESVAGKSVLVQGVGSVGSPLADKLLQEGVGKLILCDIERKRAENLAESLRSNPIADSGFEVDVINAEDVFKQKGYDIFAPCAIGGILTKETASILDCWIIAGSANNQLADPLVGRILMDRGILYAPDYVINAGGLINVDDEFHPDGYNRLRVEEKLQRIPHNLLEIFWFSKRLGMPTNEVADMLAEKRIQLKKLTG